MSSAKAPALAEREGFADVFREHFAYVWKSLRRMGVRDRDLEDLVHDVFLVVHRRAGSFDPTRPLKPWLFGILCRVASDYRRSARYRAEVLEDGEEHAHAAQAADEQVAARRAVIAALETMPDERRAVFVMHEIEGFTMPEIAEALGINLDTGYSRLRSARADFVRATDPAKEAQG